MARGTTFALLLGGLTACLPSLPTAQVEDSTGSVLDAVAVVSGRMECTAWRHESAFVTTASCGEGAGVILLRGSDERYTVQVARSDETLDVALLLPVQIVPSGETLTFAEHNPGYGEEVRVVGHPLGFTWTAARAWVTAPLREAAGRRVMQLDAPCDDGSEGSPVLSPMGKVLGMVAGFTGRQCFAVTREAIEEVLRD